MDKQLLTLEFAYRGVRIEKQAPGPNPYVIRSETGLSFYFINLAEAKAFIDVEFALYQVAVEVLGGARAVVML